MINLKELYLKTNLSYNNNKIQDNWKTTVNYFYNNFIEIDWNEKILSLKIIIDKNEFYEITNKNNFKVLVLTKNSLKLLKLEIDKDFKIICNNKLKFENNSKIIQNNINSYILFDYNLKYKLKKIKIFDYNENLVIGLTENDIHIFDLNNINQKEFFVDNLKNISPNIIWNSNDIINDFCVNNTDVGKIFAVWNNGFIIYWDIEFSSKIEKYKNMTKIYDNKSPILSIEIFKKQIIIIGDIKGKISIINYNSKEFIKSTCIDEKIVNIKFENNLLFSLTNKGILLIYNINNLNKNWISIKDYNFKSFKLIDNKFILLNTFNNEFLIFSLNDLNEFENNIIYRSPPNLLKIKTFDFNSINNNIIIKGINKHLEIMNINMDYN